MSETMRKIKKLKELYYQKGKETVISFGDSYPMDYFNKAELDELSRLGFVSVLYSVEETRIDNELFTISEKQLKEEMNENNN